jgi:hypothetical protein
MKTASLMGLPLAFAIMASLTVLGCNKKDDDAPLPAPAVVATPAATVPPAIPPPVAPPAAPSPAAVPANGAVGSAASRPVVSRDAGAKDAAVAAVTFDAGAVAFPTAIPGMPALQPSALPAIASGIVGGIIGALPSGLIPPPPAPAK